MNVQESQKLTVRLKRKWDQIRVQRNGESHGESNGIISNTNENTENKFSKLENNHNDESYTLSGMNRSARKRARYHYKKQ